jgi:RNA polymerase sigma factor (sigma-70 family)
MTSNEVLAITRLRQWSVDRLALRASRTTEYRRTGWQARNTRSFDARLVRVIDFDRALGQLSEEEQTVLLLVYRERQPQEEVCKILHCSVRKVSYILPRARKRLAETLDKMDIL